MRFPSALALTLALAAPAAAQNVPFDNTAQGISITLGGGKALVVVVMAREIDGRLALCGASFLDGSSAAVRANRRELMRDLMISIGGRPVSADIPSFAAYDTQAEAEQGGARCVASRQPWKDSYKGAEIKFRMRAGSVRTF